jgi:hypothetical protein
MRSLFNEKEKNIPELSRGTRIFFTFSAVVVIGLLFTYGLRTSNSFKGNSTESGAKIIKVFNDFDYVGVGDWDAEVGWEPDVQAPYGVITPVHPIKELIFPDKLELNKQYVFHSKIPDAENALFDRLQASLGSENIDVTFARPLAYPYVGYMKFAILFQGKNCKGFIYNKSCSNDGTIEDYILVSQ